ncbi:MAG: hypothetical protein Kow0047_29400 [Anaerolineae bacterium]
MNPPNPFYLIWPDTEIAQIAAYVKHHYAQDVAVSWHQDAPQWRVSDEAADVHCIVTAIDNPLDDAMFAPTLEPYLEALPERQRQHAFACSRCLLVETAPPDGRAPLSQMTRDHVLLAARVTRALLNETGIVYDWACDRAETAADWQRKDLRRFRLLDHFVVYAMDGSHPEATWVQTSGLARFGWPELAWEWTPAETWEEAGELLSQLAKMAADGRVTLVAHQIIHLDGADMSLRLEAAEAEDRPALRVLPATTGQAGVEAFRHITDDGRDPAAAWVRRGVQAQLDGDERAAWEAHSRAIQIDPGNVYALTNIGHLLTAHGKPQDAIEWLHRALDVDPNYALALNNLGNAHLSLGDLDAALSAYDAALAVSPGYAMPHRNRALIYAIQGRQDAAIAEYRAYLEAAPEGTQDADAHYSLGVLLEEAGELDAARQAYRHALEIRPTFAQALNNLGILHLREDDLAAAIERFREAIRADEAFALAHFNLGTALSMAGDYAQAIDALEAAARLDPENAQIRSNLGVLYTTCGRHDEAAAIFDALTERHPGNAVFHFNLAVAYQAMGRVEDARRSFAAVLDLEPEDSRRAERARQELEEMDRVRQE